MIFRSQCSITQKWDDIARVRATCRAGESRAFTKFPKKELMPGFAEKYAAHMVDRAKASGASQQKLDETERQAKVMQGAQVFLKNAVVGVVGTGLSLQQGSEYYARNTCVGRLFGVCEASRGWKQQ
jgi:hypothetical protein